MLTGASAAMLHPVMLAEVNKLIEHLLAVGALPCLLARLVEVAHMLLPINLLVSQKISLCVYQTHKTIASRVV
jgi:hypothetical protein